MIKLKKKFLLTLLPLATVSVAAPVILTSCSSTSSSSTKVGQKSFNAISKKVNGQTPTKATSETTTDAIIVDPNFNQNAIDDAHNTFKKTLNVKSLQEDFTKVLDKFYRVAEFEYEGTDGVEVEAELLSTKVVGVNTDVTPMTADLEITYEVDTEIGNVDSENRKTISKTIELNPKFATLTEIEKIKETLFNSSDEQVSNQVKLDIDDLKDLYLGDPEDNEDSIFDQVGLITNSRVNTMGGLLGYEINLEDLAYTPTKTNDGVIKMKNASSTISTFNKIFAPSSVITEFYFPDIPQIIVQDINFTVDYNLIKNLTKDELKSITSLEATNGSNLGLNDILQERIKSPNAEKISGVSIEEIPTNETSNPGDLIVTIQLSGVEPEGFASIFQFGISADWYKSTANKPAK